MEGGGELSGLSVERLEREIAELAGHINAAMARWLGLVGEFDRREAWAEWGCRSCTHWLSYRCGLSPAAAREQVRVARRVSELPETGAAFARGELCYSQVRALTRVATPDTEAQLAMIAMHATAAQLETIVRAFRGVLEVELGNESERYRRRFVRCEHDEQGALLIQARLPAEEGAVVLAALEAGRDALRKSGADALRAPGGDAPHTGGSASAETTQIGDNEPEAEPGGEPVAEERFTPSNADALVLMAQTTLTHGPAGSGGGEHQLVVHVDAATLADDDEDGACGLERGPALAPETARRLGCDASVVRILERDGRPLSVGRKTRSLPPALRRALRSRDRTCRFPGCCHAAASCTPTTSATGPRAGAPTCPTWSSSAHITTGSSTRAATRSSGAPAGRCSSAARTAARSLRCRPARTATRTRWRACTAAPGLRSTTPPAHRASKANGCSCTGSSTASPKPTRAYAP